MNELKIGDKIKCLRKSEFNNQWIEAGQGYCRGIGTNKGGYDKYVYYTDKTWTNVDVIECLPIESEYFKVVKG